VGTRLTITPQGQDSMESLITELEPPVLYADQTVFGGTHPDIPAPVDSFSRRRDDGEA
ncbi:MAG: hypothetical protein QOI02_1618, partial [Actinomycetota bacterium]|nr:hypothetical protein [Actinomycetota bacterium]